MRCVRVVEAGVPEKGRRKTATTPSSSTRRGSAKTRRGGGAFGAFVSRTDPPTHTTRHTHPTPPEHNTVFSLKGSERSPAFLPLLLLLSGDIETNPGPKHPCPTCTRAVTNHTGGLKCTRCRSWTHYTKKCSGVKQHSDKPPGWVCKPCDPTHNIENSTTQPSTSTQHTAHTQNTSTTQPLDQPLPLTSPNNPTPPSPTAPNTPSPPPLRRRKRDTKTTKPSTIPTPTARPTPFPPPSTY